MTVCDFNQATVSPIMRKGEGGKPHMKSGHRRQQVLTISLELGLGTRCFLRTEKSSHC